MVERKQKTGVNRVMIATARLLHKKELEEFMRLAAVFDKMFGKGGKIEIEPLKGYRFSEVWEWGRKRWPGKVWPHVEYRVREELELTEDDFDEEQQRW